MENKIAFVLCYYSNPVAVLIMDENETEVELKSKLERAIKEELCTDSDSQFELRMGELGDWGETTELSVTCVTDGFQVTDDEFTLMKTVSY